MNAFRRLMLVAMLAMGGPAQAQPPAGLDEELPVDRGHVAGLRLDFTLPVEGMAGEGASAFADGGQLFLLSPYPATLQAFAVREATATPLWTYRADAGLPAGRIETEAAAGAAVAGARIFLTAPDGRVRAVERDTGREIWKVRLADPEAGERLTRSPLVAGDRLIVGNDGDAFGVRGWIAALALDDGRLLWKRYSTGPDAEAGIGPRFRPRHDGDRGRDLGIATWPPEAWKRGGGAVAGPVTYDPGLGLLFHGTGSPAPASPDPRPGDNKWTSGIFARDPATGDAVWFYQWSPHDPYGLGGGNRSFAVDLAWNGRLRRALVHADANGLVYVLDRETGEVLSAEPFVHVNTMDGVDRGSGVPRRVTAKLPGTVATARDVCPAAPGATGLDDAAYSPRTGLLYIPVRALCMDLALTDAGYVRGTPYLGRQVRLKPGPDGVRGRLVAWDVARAEPAWSVEEAFPLASGVLATAAGLVFYGTMDGWLVALDAAQGTVLWRHRLDGSAGGRPFAFRGADGRGRLAVMAGAGSVGGAIAAAIVDVRDAGAAEGRAAALADLAGRLPRGSRLHVFSLP